MLRTLFISLGILFIPFSCQAKCNFKTGEFIDDMNNPSSILKLGIEIPKSAKYTKNFFKIALTPGTNIPVKFKKRFKAKIKIHYKFLIYNLL